MSLPFLQQIQFALIVNVVNLNQIIEIKELYCTTKQEEGKLRPKFTWLLLSWIWAFQVSGPPQLLHVSLIIVYMLWFNFILGLYLIFLCFGVWQCMVMSVKQRKLKFKPRIKLNHNIYMPGPHAGKSENGIFRCDAWLQILQNDSKICEAEVTLTPLISKICKPCTVN